jgi:3-phosphoshikimate 1-carboxyvinyltransferase
MIKKVSSGQRIGEINIPASKSDAQRAILVAALVPNKSLIYNYGKSDDVKAMLSCIGVLGAEKAVKNEFIEIQGATQLPRSGRFQCGESGLTFRLIAALSTVIEGSFELHGDGSLLKRDHRFIEDFGGTQNLAIHSVNGHLPYQINGGITSDKYKVNAEGTSQFLSGLLIGLSTQNKEITIHAENLTSKPYLLMTLNTISKYGISIAFDGISKFVLPKYRCYQSTNYVVEGDWSAASYWIVARLLGHELRIYGLNENSYQADKKILELLKELNVDYDLDKGLFEFSEDVFFGFDFDATDCPDLFPALTTLAVYVRGVSRIRGVHRLLNKESNRSNALVSEFKKLGANICVDGDDLLIVGGGLKGDVVVDSHGDHRIVMCLAITALNLDSSLTIEGADAVTKSYPDFWGDLKKLKRKKNGA